MPLANLQNVDFCRCASGGDRFVRRNNSAFRDLTDRAFCVSLRNVNDFVAKLTRRGKDQL